MQRTAPTWIASLAILVLGCDPGTPLELANSSNDAALAKGGPGSSTEFATRTALPALTPRVHGEAYAVDRAGSLIGGYSWDNAGYMHPVTWSLENGLWKITAYPWDESATSAVVRAVNDLGDKAGTFWPAHAPRPVIWSATGGHTVLSCNELGEALGMSSGDRIVVGVYRTADSARALLWRPGQCGETLPPLLPDSNAIAHAVNGDGTIVGGLSRGVPVRWRLVNGTWTVEPIDSRPGWVYSSNSAGDLVGYVDVPCATHCNEGRIWFVDGTSRTLPTLGGTTTAPRAINSSGEVVGMSTQANGNGVPFIWSETLGIRQLPLKSGGWAYAISDVRADGTRIVTGFGGSPSAAQVWVVRNP